jgi:acyl carrier protein
MRDLTALKAMADAAAARHAGPTQPPLSAANIEMVRRAVAIAVSLACPSFAPEHMRETHRLKDDLGLDELDHIGIALELEDGFGFTAALDHSGWRTVADVVRDTARAAAAVSLPPAADD